MKVAFHTLGCKVNQYESAAMAQMFREHGWEVVSEQAFADVYVINTCTVTAVADKKSRQYIRRMKRVNPDSIVAVTGCYAQISPDEVSKIKGVDIVTGTNEKRTLIEYVEQQLNRRKVKCIAEDISCGTEHDAEDISCGTEHDAEDVSCGTEHDAEDISCCAEHDAEEAGSAAKPEAGGKPLQVVHPYEELGTFDEMGIVSSTEGRTRAYIKVQEGCNRFCAYCVIPYARGPVRSRALEEIVEEAKSLIAEGYKELVLTGINTAQYDMEGRDLYRQQVTAQANERETAFVKATSETAEAAQANERETAAMQATSDTASAEADAPFGIEKAIAAINALPGEFRIRLSSLEPAVVNASYVKRLFKYEKLCHHLHMSAQSGSDAVLSAMNRPYTSTQYMDMVETLCAFDPCFGVSTDIIVGFPGEKEKDFEESCKMTALCAFCKTHIFKYSKRPLTRAAEMKNQVSPQLKQQRSERLQSIAMQAAEAFINMNVEFAAQGRTEEVLFEQVIPAPKDGEGITKGQMLLTGYTGNYIRVYVSLSRLGRGGAEGEQKAEELTGQFAKIRIEGIYCDGAAASVVQ